MRIINLAEALLNTFIGVVEGFLGLRFILKLFTANSNNAFVSWVYDMSDALLDPFRSVFPVRTFENQYVLEFSTLFAMLVYAIVGIVLMALIESVGDSLAPKKVKK